MNACLIPDPCSVRRCDARDIAEMVVLHARRVGRAVVFFEPNGIVTIGNARDWDANRCKRWFSFVGIYTDAAKITDVMDDLLAMERTQ